VRTRFFAPFHRKHARHTFLQDVAQPQALRTLARLEKTLWIILVSLFCAIVALVVVASSGVPVEGVLVVAVICGILSIAFSMVANSIASHKKKYSIVDDPGSAANSVCEAKNVRVDPQNPHLTTKAPIDVVALDGTNEVV